MVLTGPNTGYLACAGNGDGESGALLAAVGVPTVGEEVMRLESLSQTLTQGGPVDGIRVEERDGIVMVRPTASGPLPGGVHRVLLVLLFPDVLAAMG